MTPDDANAKIIQSGKVDAEQEIDKKTILNNTVFDDTRKACRDFGAYEVRKAARRQMEGDSNALATVGLGQYLPEHLYDISDYALARMKDHEKHHEFCQDNHIMYSWPLDR